jgi:hypothetical protein
MANMDYQLRYCAFVDILGFSELVRRLEQGAISFGNLQQLLGIVHAPPSEYQPDVFKTSDLRAQSISDAVCLSAACSEAGLAHLIYCLDQLTIRLLGAGFFLRGAIVKGRLFHDDKMVFGEALLLAYKLETEVARYPRIMIARDVAVDIQAFYKLHGHQTTFQPVEQQFLLCLEQASDGPYYLHVLREIGFALTGQKDEEQRAFSISEYNGMAEQIQMRFKESVDNPRHFEKVQWFAKYWNNTVANLDGAVKRVTGPGVKYPAFAVDAS